MVTKHETKRNRTYSRCINEMLLDAGITEIFGGDEAVDAYAESLRILESDADDGISVKAKDGNLLVTLPKRVRAATFE